MSKVIIDEAAMFEIKDTASRLFHRYLKPNRELLLLAALEQYMIKRGTEANFEVKVDHESL